MFKEYIKKNDLSVISVSILGCVLNVPLLSMYLGFLLSLGVFIIFLLVFYIFVKTKKHIIVNLYTLVFSLLYSLFFGLIISNLFNVFDVNISKIFRLLLIPSSLLSFFYFWIYILSISYISLKEKNIDKYLLLRLLFSIISIVFLFFIYLPFDTLLNNYKEYTFPCYEIIISYSYLIIVPFLLIVLCSFFSKRAFIVISNIFLSLALCIYFQFCFLNIFIGQINGAKYNWKDHPVFTIIDLFIWIALFVLPFILEKLIKKIYNEILLVIPVLIVCLSFATLIVTMINCPSIAYKYRQYHLSGEKQYRVSPKGNIIVFVIDSVDNSFIKEIYNNEKDFYDDFNDFTVYTNTCSVFDYTVYSHAQFMAGEYVYGDKSNQAGFEDIVYPRFIENDYKLNFYNFATEDCTSMEKYIDNFVGRTFSVKERFRSSLINDADSQIIVRDDMIKDNVTIITLFQILPCIFKGFINLDDVSFDLCVTNTDFVYDCDIKNDDFYNNLKLSLDETEAKYFIFQSIEGAHFPCDDYYIRTKYCLSIADKYISQMKDLGVYDDSLIIILSDHGIHDGVDGIPYPTAATPMLFIKEPKEHHDEVVLNNAPVYHEDIVPTILANCGLYKDGDEYTVGKSVYDFKDGDYRERVWYDRGFESDTFYVYTYTGDTSDLEYQVKNGLFEMFYK